jgi:hypothetical protein
LGFFIFWQIVLEAAQIWQELSLHYFPADCFEGGSDLAGTGFTLFSGILFWRQLRFGGNGIHIIFRRIVLETAQIWRELAPHYILADCSSPPQNVAQQIYWYKDCKNSFPNLYPNFP